MASVSSSRQNFSFILPLLLSRVQSRYLHLFLSNLSKFVDRERASVFILPVALDVRVQYMQYIHVRARACPGNFFNSA